MINKTIKLKIESNNLTYNTITDFDKLYFSLDNINNINENIINLYSNINYTIYFPNLNIDDTKYYFIITNSFSLFKKELVFDNNTFNYLYGIKENNFILDENNISYISFSNNFTTNDIDKTYNWYIYKLSKTNSSGNVYDKCEYIQSGLLKINNPLIYIKLNYKQEKLIIHDIENEYYTENKDYIRLESSLVLGEIKDNIILFRNINYLFEIKDLNNININKQINIYNNSIEDINKLSELQNNLNIIKFSTVNLLDKKKYNYKWKLDIDIGKIILIDEIKNVANDEILYDDKFKNINIINKLIYNKFDYNEYINIIVLKNNINYLIEEYSNNLIVIDNNINNITVVLPSTNVYVGLIYNIILLNDLLYLNFQFEDKNLHLTNYDTIQGSFFVSNKNNLYCKTNLSSIEIIDNKKTIQLSKDIILKTNVLKNNIIYNSGLYKYSYIKLVCINKIDNKFIWNIEGNLIGNSLNYKNTYNYNPFL